MASHGPLTAMENQLYESKTPMQLSNLFYKNRLSKR